LLIGDNINQKSFNMMKFLRLLICVCILLIADQTVYSAQEKWIFINQDQGVTMHSRKVAGRAESEFRGSSTIDQPVEVVGAVLADIPSFTRWFYKCIQARKIPDKTSNDGNLYKTDQCRRESWKLPVGCGLQKDRIQFPGEYA